VFGAAYAISLLVEMKEDELDLGIWVNFVFFIIIALIWPVLLFIQHTHEAKVEK
jgi:hypothetical protein